MADILQFDPYVSRIEAGFWHELAQRKLEEYKLSEAKQAIWGCYSNGRGIFCLAYNELGPVI